MQKKLLPGLIAVAALAGCADVPQANEAPVDKGEMVTGSNIPRKKGSLPSGVQRVEGDDIKAGNRMNAPMPSQQTGGTSR